MATPLLNDDGTASMATALMCSHHAVRRDLACFARALAGEVTRGDVLTEAWQRFREGLHHHHTAEDAGIFPDLRAKGVDIERLEADHRAIDPLLDRGDRLFTDPCANAEAARRLVAELGALLADHLDLEERIVTPHLRAAKQFPLPPSDDVVAAYADGFAWASCGIADSVLEPLFAMLPPALAARIPAARVAFDERCLRLWGHTHTGRSVTSAPAISG
jgi:hypothetical protein